MLIAGKSNEYSKRTLSLMIRSGDLVPLLPSEIRRDFTPLFGVPFQDGNVPGVVFEPFFGAVDHLKHFSVAGCGFEFGVGMFAFHPRKGRHRIGVDGNVAAFLFEQGQAMHDGQKLADVVGGIGIGAAMKDLLSGFGIYALVFHHAGISAACGIYRKAVPHRPGACRSMERCFFCAAFTAQVVPHVSTKSLYGLLFVRECLVTGALETFDLLLALVPTAINAGIIAFPNHIILRTFFCHDKNQLILQIEKCPTKMKKIIYYFSIAVAIFTWVWIYLIEFENITEFMVAVYTALGLFLVIFGAYGLYAEKLWKRFRAQGKTENLCVEANYHVQKLGFLGRVFLFPFMKVKSSNSFVIAFLGALAWIIIFGIIAKAFINSNT